VKNVKKKSGQQIDAPTVGELAVEGNEAGGFWKVRKKGNPQGGCPQAGQVTNNGLANNARGGVTQERNKRETDRTSRQEKKRLNHRGGVFQPSDASRKKSL